MIRIFELLDLKEKGHLKFDKVSKVVKDNCDHPLWLDFVDSEIEEIAKELPELMYPHFCVCAKCNTLKFILNVEKLEFGEDSVKYGIARHGAAVTRIDCSNSREMKNIMFTYYNTNFMAFLEEAKDWPCTDNEKAKYFLADMELKKNQVQKTIKLVK